MLQRCARESFSTGSSFQVVVFETGFRKSSSAKSNVFVGGMESSPTLLQSSYWATDPPLSWAYSVVSGIFPIQDALNEGWQGQSDQPNCTPALAIRSLAASSPVALCCGFGNDRCTYLYPSGAVHCSDQRGFFYAD